MKRSGNKKPPASLNESPADFAEAIGDVTPLSHHGRYLHPAVRQPPLPLSRFKDEREVILESMEDPIRWQEDVEMGDDASFIRPGLSRQGLRRLRQGEWLIQAELDLHGLTKVEAKIEMAEFLS